jgi:hypothetical protein
VPAVASTVCQVAYFYGGDAVSPPVTPVLDTRTFDASKGALTVRFRASDSQPAGNAYSFYNSQGRPLGSCVGPTDPFYCTEWVRDAHGNVIAVQSIDMNERDVRLLDADHFGMQLRGSVMERFKVTYDSAGVLLSGHSRNGVPTVRQTFTEDDQHRCTDVLWETLADPSSETPTGDSERDHWTWQGDRLVSRLVTNATDPSDVRSEITYTYDANGELVATVVDGIPKLPGSSVRANRDGVADYVVRTVALPDGSRWVDSLLFRSTFSNATVTRNGQPATAERRRFNYSPGCGAVQVPRRTSRRCEFQPRTFEVEIHWDDPFTTPYPRW